MLQFNNEADTANLRLAEELETATVEADLRRKASASAAEMARALTVAIAAAKDQRVARNVARGKLQDAEALAARLQRDIADYQSQARCVNLLLRRGRGGVACSCKLGSILQ